MADLKISQLNNASTPLSGTEELAIVQSGNTVKATAQNIADLAGGGGSQDLQSVCNVGNTTDTNIYLLYSDSGDESVVNFLNQDISGVTYKIEKPAGPESLRIMALTPSGANEEFGLSWEGGDNTLKTIYNDQQLGLFLDFANPYYILGSFNSVIEYNNYIRFSRFDGNSGEMYLENAGLVDNDPATTFKHYIQSNWDIGFQLFSYGFNNEIFSSLTLSQSGYAQIQTYTSTGGASGNIYADFNQSYFNVYDGSYTGEARITNNSGTRTFQVLFAYNGSTFGLDATNTTLTASNNLTTATAGGNAGKYLKIKIAGVQYKIALLNN
jgi:hypothetical protein